MDDKVVNISFNVWANNEQEAIELKQSICDFIEWFGQRGKKVSASKLSNAINNWQKNVFVRNQIINYFNMN